MGGAIAIIATKTDASAGGHHHSTITHTGIQGNAIEGIHEGGGAQSHARLRDSKDSKSEITGKVVSMSLGGEKGRRTPSQYNHPRVAKRKRRKPREHYTEEGGWAASATVVVVQARQT